MGLPHFSINRFQLEVKFSLVDVPFDLAAIQDTPDWREKFVWPLRHQAIYAECMPFVHRVIVNFDTLDKGFVKDTLLVCLPRLLSSAVSLIETAMLIEASETLSQKIIGGPREVYLLKGEPIPDVINFTEPAEAKVTKINFAAARRLARIKSWSTIRKLPKAIFAPDAMAISHNHLLRANAENFFIGFIHAEKLLDPRDLFIPPKNMFKHSLEFVFSEVDRLVKISEFKRGILKSLICDTCEPHFVEACNLVHAARAIPKIPDVLWAGTGGFRPARAIRVEAKRRGCRVVGHDHSCSAGLISEREGFALTELAVASEFVVPTKKSKEILESAGNKYFLKNIGEAKISHAFGDPSLGWSPRFEKRAKHQKPRILYVSGAFTGFRQRLPPRIPDIVKLDWQIRLIQMMNKMPVDLKLQMHPGGILHGNPHPADVFAKGTGTTFEEAAQWAQVMVFDVIQSTTFPLALVTKCPIVLLDHGMNKFCSNMHKLLSSRCKILTVSRDDRNRAYIDEEQLRSAILDVADTNPDPSPFRDMFAGRYARHD